ncbi:MAG TPA: hypothetical protein VH083_08490 [Myxococcales bacterium]|nr:hypothetical protein [Myxococcales bacterium]
MAGSVSAAKSRVMQARDYADKNRKDDALDKLTEAEKFLDGLSEAEKAPIVKDIAELRTQLAGAVDPEVSGRLERNVGRLLNVAEDDADSSPRNASNELDLAIDALNTGDAKQNLNAAARGKLQARVDSLQAKLKGNNASAAAKQFTERIERNLRAASENAGNDPRFARTRLDEAATLLASDEAKQKLDAATISRLQGSLAEGEAKLGGSNKQDALSRAAPLMKSLEERLASDPYKDAAPGTAYKVSADLESLQVRVTSQLEKLPAGDADRRSYEDRLAAARKKIETYDTALSTGNTEAALANRWKFTTQGFEGWRNESAAPSGRAFEKPALGKTEQAVRGVQFFLAEKETVDARSKAAALPKAAAVIAEADKTLADAQAKLDAAFNQWMDAAEKQPRPQGSNRFDIGSAADMARWANDRLAGSAYQTADVARAKKLDQRWQDELAAIKQQHEAALKQMTADANAAWPKMAAAANAKEGFHPSDAASQKGKTFRFAHVRNRSGWDFDGRYDIVIWVDGQPVAGTYAPKIKQAFSDAARKIGDSVDDHIDWEVIAVIDGKGVANRRYTTEVKDDRMNVLGKIEGTHQVDCVLMRVIAVHAGPVAVSAN